MLAIDIETIPTLAALALPYPEEERKPPANMSKPETIAAWREGDRAKWETDRIKDYSLNPRFGRVAAIGYRSADVGWVDHSATEDDEATLLTLCWSHIQLAGKIATFNGMGFDLPFLVTRSILLGVEPFPVADYLRRYSTAKHLDCRMVLTNWDSYAKGTMGDWLAAMGLPPKQGTGGDVWAMAQAGEWEQIRAYAKSDADLTYQMALRVEAWFR